MKIKIAIVKYNVIETNKTGKYCCGNHNEKCLWCAGRIYPTCKLFEEKFDYRQYIKRKTLTLPTLPRR
jgi:hypothetical protein